MSYSDFTETEYIASQVAGLTVDTPSKVRYDTPYSPEFANPWGLKECPQRIFLYGEIMSTWFHRPDLEGYANAPDPEGSFSVQTHDQFLPYDEFEVFAMQQGWS